MEQNTFEEFKNDKRIEYQHLKNDILTNNRSENKSINWFISYNPISQINNSHSKENIIKKINDDYKNHLYIDPYYKFKSDSTFKIKFPKVFIKFEYGLKRYGCISFYGVRNSVIQDYYFFSKNGNEFFLNKIMFKQAFLYNSTTKSIKEINFSNNSIINSNDIDDIYVLALSGDNHKYLDDLKNSKNNFFDFSNIVYDGITPTNLDLYKNSKLIKSFDIDNCHYKMNNHIIEIYNRNNELIKKFDILEN